MWNNHKNYLVSFLKKQWKKKVKTKITLSFPKQNTSMKIDFSNICYVFLRKKRKQCKYETKITLTKS